jgi:hypothetical protein
LRPLSTLRTFSTSTFKDSLRTSSCRLRPF